MCRGRQQLLPSSRWFASRRAPRTSPFWKGRGRLGRLAHVVTVATLVISISDREPISTPSNISIVRVLRSSHDRDR